MKRIFSIALLLVMLTLPASVSAGTTHFVHRLDMQVALPDNFDVMTREMEEDNPLIPLYGGNADEVKAFMAENDFYFLGTDYEDYVVLIGMVNDGDDYGISEHTDEELEALEKVLAQETGSDFAMFIDHPQIKLFKYGTVKNEEAQIGYITFENGRRLMIFVVSTGAEITEEMEEFSDDFINSIYFGNSTFGEGWKKLPQASPVEAESELYETLAAIIGIALLIYLCIVPVLIYRFGIRKRPVEAVKAKWIAAIIAITLLVFLIAIDQYSAQNRSLKWVAVACQFINYHIMVCGAKKYSQAESSDGEGEQIRTETIHFTVNSEEDISELRNKIESLIVCPNCGNELLSGTKSCHNCGKDLEE